MLARAFHSLTAHFRAPAGLPLTEPLYPYSIMFKSSLFPDLSALHLSRAFAKRSMVTLGLSLALGTVWLVSRTPWFQQMALALNTGFARNKQSRRVRVQKSSCSLLRVYCCIRDSHGAPWMGIVISQPPDIPAASLPAAQLFVGLIRPGEVRRQPVTYGKNQTGSTR